MYELRKHGISFKEYRRRTVVKSLVWRFIGVIWTWLGAYFIILLVPPSYKTASIIATLIVIYHHSTRLIMYYFYERIWASILWGKFDGAEGLLPGMSVRGRIIWIMGTITAVVFIFTLALYVGPMLKK